MATNDYEIVYSDGQRRINVGENTINASTSIDLVGHGQPTYGVPQNTNFLHLLENFASIDEPRNPTLGQIWFKQITDDHGNVLTGKFELNVCSAVSDGGVATWSKMSHVVTDGSGDIFNTGDLFYDATNKKLKVWDASLGTEGEWNTIGPTDIVHTQHVYDSMLVTPQTTSVSYDKFDMSAISEDITESGGSIQGVTGNGSLNLVKMTIMAKEFNNGGTLSFNNAKSCVWLYKFAIRSVKTGANTHQIKIIGAPSYELIAQNPEDLDWNIDIKLQDSQLIVNVVFNTVSQYHITLGFDSEVTRI